MTYDDKMNWLLKCRDEGHLNEWDVSGAIEECRDAYDLRKMLMFLIQEEILVIRKEKVD